MLAPLALVLALLAVVQRFIALDKVVVELKVNQRKANLGLRSFKGLFLVYHVVLFVVVYV
jgi:hypothetical protein